MRLADWQAYRDQLKPDVIEVEARLNVSGLFELINKALLNRRAFLFVSSDGWCVLHPESTKGIPSVNILFAKSYTGGSVHRHTSAIELMAREIGSRYLTTYTKDTGLASALGQFGFNLESTDSVGLHFLKKTL